MSSDSPEATERIAAEFATQLRQGDVIALHGELGAGKTCFTRGLVAGLGGEPSAVSSPTYTLLQVYPTPAGDVFHLDAYRAVPDDLEELLDEAFVTIIEWPQRADIDATIQVTIEHAANGRVINVQSPRLQAWVDEHAQTYG